jgi:hypothetical protein
VARASADRRVIALWAVPRSVSTAFEMTFARRPDTEVVHEPFTDCYYFSRVRRSDRYGDQPHKHRRDGAWAVEQIERCPAPVAFVKDLCFQAEPYATERFLHATTNTVILRSPDAVLASLAPLKPDFTDDEFGFLALERMWRRLVHGDTPEPVVVEGDVFRAHPEYVLRDYCARVGVAFVPEMLHWPRGRIREWSPDERESQAKWHRTLESSTGILPPREPDPEVRVPPQLAGTYRRAWEIYDEVSAYALRPVRPFAT